jgi:multidrug resistance efflux pump
VNIEDARLEWLRQRSLALRNRVELQRQGGGAVDGALGAALRAVLEAGDEEARAKALAVREVAEANLQHLLERRDAIGHAIDAAQARLASLAAAGQDTPISDTLASQLSTIHAEAQVQEANLRGIELEIDGLEIRSPVTGKIVTISRHPGQSVQLGTEVMVVAREQSESAIAYLRSDLRIRPELDMRVYVWPRDGRSRPVEARVAGVGPQMQEIPELVARSQKVREWGLPVMVRLPPGYRARPGEVVNVRFPRGEEGP